MIIINDFFTQAGLALSDYRFVRWTKAEIVNYINDGLNAILIRKPNAFIATLEIEVTANPIALPDDAYILLSVESINGLKGQFVTIESLDRYFPQWRVTTGKPECWTKSQDELTQFWLYPAPKDKAIVKVLYGKALKITIDSSSLDIPIQYQSVLLDYVLYRAFSKDAENASEAAKSTAHYQLFNNALADKNTTDSAVHAINLQSSVE